MLLINKNNIIDYDFVSNWRRKMKDKAKGFFAEFKKFVMRGNVIDMAIGVVIGASFTSIVNSIVQDIINPIIGLLVGKIDFKDLRLVLIKATEENGEVAIRYGQLLQNILQFIITAFVLFIIVKSINKIKERKEAEEKAKKKTEEKKEEVKVESKETILLTEIRDLLKNKA